MVRSFCNSQLFIYLFVFCITTTAQNSAVKLVTVDSGWANNSINTVIFRKNSLTTWQDTQFIAFYNKLSYVVLGKRKLGTQNWILQQTAYKGNTSDAHNTISIITDVEGYLHMAWDHHNHPLRYAKSTSQGSLVMTDKLSMTGNNEENVSYPEFYKLPNGNLLFFYRNGRSGRGNLVVNHYDVAAKKWEQLHSNLIDGEGERNAYWQAYADSKGIIHVSWVWRETPDVASNHDLCYARSDDGGKTWEKSSGEKYSLPITATTAEYAWRIPQKSELINQTSMSADENGNPVIATYWRDANDSVPQYHLVYHNGKRWEAKGLTFRNTAFSLSGQGTKRIPIARPQVLVKGNKPSVMLIFRDEARGSRASAVAIKNLRKKRWKIIDLSQSSLGSWEPTYDTELWKEKGVMHLFLQKVEQVDAEGRATIPPQMIYVLEWKPKF